MKRIFKRLFLMTVLILSVNLLPYALEQNISANIPTIKRFICRGNFENLIDSIAVEETGDIKSFPRCWDTINYLGMIGRYQFSKTALLDIGVDTSSSSIKYFLKHHKFQTTCMKTLIKRNLQILDWCVDYKKYLNTRINGIEITLSGILAASHLGGVGAVRNYLYSGGKINASDGHDTISDYISKFGNYYVQI